MRRRSADPKVEFGLSSSTHQYLEKLAAVRGEAIVVTTMTSAMTWPLLSTSVLDLNYLPSAMSHAGDIALGLALTCPERKVVCVNGDGSLLMNLGALATALENGATNLVMLLMENGTYDVGGGSRVPGRDLADFAAIAHAAGWPVARRFASASAFGKGLSELLNASGPVFASLTVRETPSPALQLPAKHPRDALRDLRAALRAAP